MNEKTKFNDCVDKVYFKLHKKGLVNFENIPIQECQDTNKKFIKKKNTLQKNK